MKVIRQQGAYFDIRFDYQPDIVRDVNLLPGRVPGDQPGWWNVPLVFGAFVKEFALKHGFPMEALEVQENVVTRVKFNSRIFLLRCPPTDMSLVASASSIRGAQWVQSENAWGVPATEGLAVKAWAELAGAEIQPAAQQVINLALNRAEVIEQSKAKSSDYRITGLAYEPYDYQHAGVDYVVNVADGKCIIGDEPGVGKAHPLTEPILTPDGYVPMGDLKPGNYVVGSDGQPTEVLGVYPQPKQRIYRVVFSDGSYSRVTGQHLWQVADRKHRKSQSMRHRVLTTDAIREAGLRHGGSRRFRIPMTQPVAGVDRWDLDPYLVGALIGDGNTSLHYKPTITTDDEIVHSLNLPTGGTAVKSVDVAPGVSTYRLNGCAEAFRQAGLMDKRAEDKNIPAVYKSATPSARVALLQGLFDTDGTNIAGRAGKVQTSVEYGTVSKQLAEDVRSLVQSLGGTASITPKETTYTHKGERHHGQTYYRMVVSLPSGVTPFRLTRKLAKWTPRTKYEPSRYIVAIEPDGFEAAQCIRVAAEDHLYLTRDYVVTHNTLQAIGVLAVMDAFPALIVCPASLKLNWRDEIRKALPGKSVEILSGTAPSEPRLLWPDVTIVNYDIIHAWEPVFPDEGFKAVVADESHKIKNPMITRSKSVIRIMNKAYPVRLCLTGTAIKNRPQEILSQVQAIGRIDWLGGITKARKSVQGQGAALNRALRSFCYVRRLKADVWADAPGKHWAPIIVEGDPAIMAEYREAEANITKYLAEKAETAARASGATDLEAEDAGWVAYMKANAAQHLVMVSQLKQIAARAKLAQAKEWARNFMESGEKLGIFAWNTAIVDAMAEELGAVKVQGGQSLTERDRAVRAFQNNPKVQVICGQILAAGEGLNLTAASNMLMLQQAWSPTEMDQCIDRFHRRGQTQNVTGWMMLTADTIEQDIDLLLEAKRVIVRETLDGVEHVEGDSILQDIVVNLTRKGLERGRA